MTSARTMRENPAHEPATSASNRPAAPGPTKPATATMKLMPGIPWNTLLTIVRTASVRPPKYPASTPTIVPMPSASTVETRESRIALRPP